MKEIFYCLMFVQTIKNEGGEAFIPKSISSVFWIVSTALS